MQTPVHLNETKAPTIKVPCLLCRGLNPNCTFCIGGMVVKKSCRRCGGVGKEGSAACVDCQGQGWRGIDQQQTTFD
jgi:DnaJ-class molecular chaperone